MKREPTEVKGEVGQKGSVIKRWVSTSTFPSTFPHPPSQRSKGGVKRWVSHFIHFILGGCPISSISFGGCRGCPISSTFHTGEPPHMSFLFGKSIIRKTTRHWAPRRQCVIPKQDIGCKLKLPPSIESRADQDRNGHQGSENGYGQNEHHETRQA
jgi:hypothetical protein